jgi:hypothetical protein
MAAICQRLPQPIAQIATVGKVEAEHAKIHRIWTTRFYIDGCGTLQTVTLRWPIFKPKERVREY